VIGISRVKSDVTDRRIASRRQSPVKSVLTSFYGVPFCATTVLLNASQIAMRNHQGEKIIALRNAILNAALGELPDDIERSIVLALIDRLTPTHVSVLSLMQEPTKHKAVEAYTARWAGLRKL
jgi:hypothetical protein